MFFQTNDKEEAFRRAIETGEKVGRLVPRLRKVFPDMPLFVVGSFSPYNYDQLNPRPKDPRKPS